MKMKTNILTLVITMVVGIILAGSLLTPVISDAQNTIEPITKTNDTAVLLRPAEDGDVLKATFDTTIGWVWSLNDVTIEGIGDNTIEWNTYLISDAAYLSGRGTTGWASSITIFDTNPTTYGGFGNSNYGNEITVTFSGNSMTFAGPVASPLTFPQTVNYTWAYVVCPEIEATYCAAVAGGSAYVNSTDDVILCGVYTTGENDCSYYMKDGETRVIGGDYAINVNQNMVLTEGTNDIYTDTISVDIGEENFTPFRIFVPYEVNGHATNGATISLLGAIPIMVIVALLMAAVGAIALRRAD